MSGFVVVWDNGNDTGEFPTVFATEEAAQEYGEWWVAEMEAIDPDSVDGDSGYSFDVAPHQPRDLDGPTDFAVEGTVGNFDRYIAGDR